MNEPWMKKAQSHQGLSLAVGLALAYISAQGVHWILLLFMHLALGNPPYHMGMTLGPLDITTVFLLVLFVELFIGAMICGYWNFRRAWLSGVLFVAAFYLVYPAEIVFSHTRWFYPKALVLLALGAVAALAGWNVRSASLGVPAQEPVVHLGPFDRNPNLLFLSAVVGLGLMTLISTALQHRHIFIFRYVNLQAAISVGGVMMSWADFVKIPLFLYACILMRIGYKEDFRHPRVRRMVAWAVGTFALFCLAPIGMFLLGHQ